MLFEKRRDSLAGFLFKLHLWKKMNKEIGYSHMVSDWCNETNKKLILSFNFLLSYYHFLGESSVEAVTSEVTGGHGNSKYTGQYKKNTAPNKPARKHKPKSAHDHTGESRSDRSASPDNSSTSGNIFLITVLKIRKLQKQIMFLFSILPKKTSKIFAKIYPSY